jgi:hypothetical protein
MQAFNAEASTSLIRELSGAELALVCGATEYKQVLQVDLGNMTIRGYVGPGGETMGLAVSGQDVCGHRA